MSIIRKKDEKIRCLLIEKHSLNPGELSEFPSPLLVATDRSLITDQNKIQLRNLNLKDLKVFLHSNRPTLSETNRMTPNPESSRVISNVNV